MCADHFTTAFTVEGRLWAEAEPLRRRSFRARASNHRKVQKKKAKCSQANLTLPGLPDLPARLPCLTCLPGCLDPACLHMLQQMRRRRPFLRVSTRKYKSGVAASAAHYPVLSSLIEMCTDGGRKCKSGKYDYEEIRNN